MPVLPPSHWGGAHTWTPLQHTCPCTCSDELPLGRHPVTDTFPAHHTRQFACSSAALTSAGFSKSPPKHIAHVGHMLNCISKVAQQRVWMLCGWLGTMSCCCLCLGIWIKQRALTAWSAALNTFTDRCGHCSCTYKLLVLGAATEDATDHIVC